MSELSSFIISYYAIHSTIILTTNQMCSKVISIFCQAATDDYLIISFCTANNKYRLEINNILTVFKPYKSTAGLHVKQFV